MTKQETQFKISVRAGYSAVRVSTENAELIEYIGRLTHSNIKDWRQAAHTKVERIRAQLDKIETELISLEALEKEVK